MAKYTDTAVNGHVCELDNGTSCNYKRRGKIPPAFYSCCYSEVPRLETVTYADAEQIRVKV